jgi:hypothetical protein
MKIHEIVTEANLLGTGLEAGAKLLGKLGGKAKPELDTAIKNAGVIKEPIRKGATKEPSWIEKGYEKARQAKTDKALAAQKSQMLAYATKHYGEETINLFKTLNLVDVAVEWSWEFYQLQMKRKAGMSKEDYEAALADLNGRKLIQWLAPKILTGLANKASFLVRWIPAIAQWAKFPATAQLMRTIPAVVTSGAFTAFFASPAGRQWVQNVFGDLIAGVGKIPMYLTDFISAVSNGVTQGKELWDKATGDNQGAQPSNDIGNTSTGPSGSQDDEQGELTGTKDEYGKPMRKKKLEMPKSSTPGWDQGNFSLRDVNRR